MKPVGASDGLGVVGARVGSNVGREVAGFRVGDNVGEVVGPDVGEVEGSPVGGFLKNNKQFDLIFNFTEFKHLHFNQLFLFFQRWKWYSLACSHIYLFSKNFVPIR